MGHMCEGSGNRRYDIMAGDPSLNEKGHLKCDICDKYMRPRVHTRNRRHETWVTTVYTLPNHERHGVIERYCPNPDCEAQLKIDLDKVVRNIRCPKCGLVFWFPCAANRKYTADVRDAERANVTRMLIKQGLMTANC